MSTCQSCGAAVATDAQFCPGCGKDLSVEHGDKVGAGRYILSFLLAGLIGVGIQYFLREKGWLATWINLGIFVIVVVLLLAAA